MKVLVPIRCIAFLDNHLGLREAGNDFEQSPSRYQLNDFDEYSLEAAVQIKEGKPEGSVEVVVLAVGPDAADDVLRKALAKGADRAIRIWGDAFENSDRAVMARVIASRVECENPSLVICGTPLSDHGRVQTGIIVAGLLGWTHMTVVSRLNDQLGENWALVEPEIESDLLQRLAIEMPAVLTVTHGINEPRDVSSISMMQASLKPLQAISLKFGSADWKRLGLPNR